MATIDGFSGNVNYASPEEEDNAPLSEAEHSAQNPSATHEAAGFEGSLEESIPLRLQTLAELSSTGYEDLDSPRTPHASVMAQYADPQDLPGPTVERNKSVSYGSVSVPRDAAGDYQKVRQHMAMSDKGRKYLAAVENAPIKTEVYPYVNQEPPKALGEKNMYYPAVVHQTVPRSLIQPPPNSKAKDKLIVLFPADQGLITTEGGTLSAATAGAHEIGHAARLANNDMALYKQSLNSAWDNSEEHNVIRKLESDIAKSNGETGNRDDHHHAGLFRTSDITSSVPMNENTRRLLAQHAPELQKLTKEMDRQGTGPFAVNDTLPLEMQHPLLVERGNVASELKDSVHANEKHVATVEMAKQGISAEAIMARLNLPIEQIHHTLAHAVVEMNGQGMSPEAIANRLHLPQQQIDYALARHKTVNMAEQGLPSETIAARLHVSPDQVGQMLDHAVMEMSGQGMFPEAIANRLHLPPDQVLTTITETSVVQTANLMAANGMPIANAAQMFGKTLEEFQGIDRAVSARHEAH